MKHIVIVGAGGSGKSITVGAICKALNPSKIYRIDPKKDKPIEEPLNISIANGTYIIEVEGKMVLVVAGAPTEQQWCISDIVKYVVDVLHINIIFIIAARRKVERTKDFDTIQELREISKCIHIEPISFIEGTTKETIFNNLIFKERVNRLVNIIKQDI